MGLYRVMLVDDEEDVRQAIARKINWEEIGFQVVASAENGQEALELAERLHPDVVMTDIKMPFMDGLTLGRALKKRLKNIKVIIFSGFDEFEYAKEAIKLEAEEYLLKPLNAAELETVFKRIRENLDREIDQKRNESRLQRLLSGELTHHAGAVSHRPSGGPDSGRGDRQDDGLLRDGIQGGPLCGSCGNGGAHGGCRRKDGERVPERAQKRP